MEELREAAIAYYSNASRDLRTAARKFFKSMDANRDGKVSLIEYVGFLRQQGYDWIRPDLFAELDRNGDGFLDFWEVLTLYYMVKTRTVRCNKCRAVLKGLYFTCVKCFDRRGDTYNLCSTCYRRRKFWHRHNNFLDSYVLLQSRRGTSTTGTTNLSLAQPSIPPPVAAAVPANPQSQWLDAFQALEAVFVIGSVASGGCTVM